MGEKSAKLLLLACTRRATGPLIERDGGVCLEVEALALTRPIPGSLPWLVSPCEPACRRARGLRISVFGPSGQGTFMTQAQPLPITSQIEQERLVGVMIYV